MEARCYDRHGAETLCSLQKFEEHLHKKEMEITGFELEIYSSRKEVSQFKKFRTESSSEYMANSHEGKVVLRAGEVEQINERLQILEEEGEIVKQVFLGSMEERKKLMNEIKRQFQNIQSHLRNKPTGEESREGALIINPIKDGRMETGLSQVLRKDSNPSLVTRDLRANMLAFQEPAGVVHEFSHR